MSGVGGGGGGYFVSLVNEVISKSLPSLYTPPPPPARVLDFTVLISSRSIWQMLVYLELNFKVYISYV